MEFPTTLEAVYARIDAFDPAHYARSRNFLNGGVSYLSPYLSRGFITVPQVVVRFKERGIGMDQAEKFIQELAWREFYTRTWFQKGDAIFSDIRHPQEGVLYQGIPAAVLEAETGIESLDAHLKAFPKGGICIITSACTSRPSPAMWGNIIGLLLRLGCIIIYWMEI